VRETGPPLRASLRFIGGSFNCMATAEGWDQKGHDHNHGEADDEDFGECEGPGCSFGGKLLHSLSIIARPATTAKLELSSQVLRPGH